MGRFYLHIKAGGDLHYDEEGVELPSIDAARKEALLSAREMLAGAIKAGKPPVAEALVIADENGRALELVPLSSVLPESLKK
jgi:hypothetical protein